ncbi:mCG1031072, isoform CRA_a, partial [Mus musculus]
SHFSHFSLLFPFSLSSSFLSSLPLSLSFSLAFPPLFLPSLSPCISIIKLLNHRESLLHQDPLRTLGLPRAPLILFPTTSSRTMVTPSTRDRTS